MKTFKEYTDSFFLTCNPEMLDFGAKGSEYLPASDKIWKVQP
jgi:hypothetical protein